MVRSRAAGKTPIILCPLDHALVSGSSQVSNTLISIWKLTEQVQQALHDKFVSLFPNLKTHKPSWVCEDENHHRLWTLQDKDAYFVINNVLGFF